MEGFTFCTCLHSALYGDDEREREEWERDGVSRKKTAQLLVRLGVSKPAVECARRVL